MADNRTLIRHAQEGNENARRTVIEENLSLVWSIARRFQNRGYELEDLFQIGCMGLIKAIDKFDLALNVQLSTYAVPVIIGEIKRYIRDDGMVKISRTLKEQAYRIMLAKNKIAQDCGREATIEEIAVATELSLEEVVVSLDANQSIDSLDRVIVNGAGDQAVLQDFIPEVKSNVELVQQKIYVEQLMHTLTRREKEIITMRYFEDRTQVEIGARLQLSQVQVSRIEKRALQKMRGAKCEHPTPNL